MEKKSYNLAGWLAIAQAILFPMAIGLGIVEAGISSRFLGYYKPAFGPSDFIMIGFTAIAVYTFLMFKRLLNERYDYHDLDILIYISVAWAVLFQIVGLALGFMVTALWPFNKEVIAIVYIVFMTGAMVTIGIVDVLIAVKLLKVKENFSEYIRIFAYISMIAGILEVTVLLSPISLLLIPVSCIILALIFFKDHYQVEFV